MTTDSCVITKRNQNEKKNLNICNVQQQLSFATNGFSHSSLWLSVSQYVLFVRVCSSPQGFFTRFLGLLLWLFLERLPVKSQNQNRQNRCTAKTAVAAAAAAAAAVAAAVASMPACCTPEMSTASSPSTTTPPRSVRPSFRR